MGGRFRVEVDDEHGTVGLVIDPPPSAQLARAAPLARQAVDGLLWLPGVASAEHARLILLAELTRQYADELAAGRVQRREEAAAELQGRLF